MTLIVPYNRRYVASSTILIHWIHQVIHIRYFSESFIQKRFPDEVSKGPSSLLLKWGASFRQLFGTKSAWGAIESKTGKTHPSWVIQPQVHWEYKTVHRSLPHKNTVKTLRYFSQTAMIAVFSNNILKNQAVILA